MGRGLVGLPEDSGGPLAFHQGAGYACGWVGGWVGGWLGWVGGWVGSCTWFAADVSCFRQGDAEDVDGGQGLAARDRDVGGVGGLDGQVFALGGGGGVGGDGWVGGLGWAQAGRQAGMHMYIIRTRHDGPFIEEDGLEAQAVDAAQGEGQRVGRLQLGLAGQQRQEEEEENDGSQGSHGRRAAVKGGGGGGGGYG